MSTSQRPLTEGMLDLERLDARELRDLLTSVLDDNADGILLVDAEGLVLTANPAAARLLGRARGELVGESFGQPLALDGTEIDFVARPGAVAEMRVGRTTVQGAPVRVVTLRDISERKKADDQLRNFISVASHEFRSPITSIMGFAETLLEQWEDLGDDAKRRFLEVIERQAGHLSRLVTDLLSLSRIEQGTDVVARRTDVRDAVALAIESMGEDVEVELDVPPGLHALVDPDHLTEMVANYLGNALKYGSPPIWVTARRRDDDIDVVVVDHGRGVPPAFVPRLFQRFARDRGTERAQPGSGLGLSIVAELAKRNGGSVWYRPNTPRGSRFGISLPAA